MIKNSLQEQNNTFSSNNMQPVNVRKWRNHGFLSIRRQIKHPTKKGRVTIPHPKKDLPVKTVASILKQAGINKEDIK